MRQIRFLFMLNLPSYIDHHWYYSSGDEFLLKSCPIVDNTQCCDCTKHDDEMKVTIQQNITS